MYILTKEELMKRAGIEDLRDIVTARRRRFAGHVTFAKRTPCKCSHEVDTDRRQQKKRKIENSMAKNLPSRFAGNGHRLEQCSKCRTWRALVARCSNRSGRNKV